MPAALGEWIHVPPTKGFRFLRDGIRVEDEEPMPEYWILREPVPWSAIAEIVGEPWERTYQNVVGRTVEPDDPAVLRSRQMQEFAARTGTRLPTLMELLRALELGLVVEDASGYIQAEWVSNPDTMDFTLGYRYGREFPISAYGETTAVIHHAGLKPDNGFRLVRAAVPPADLRAETTEADSSTNSPSPGNER